MSARERNGAARGSFPSRRQMDSSPTPSNRSGTVIVSASPLHTQPSSTASTDTINVKSARRTTTPASEDGESFNSLSTVSVPGNHTTNLPQIPLINRHFGPHVHPEFRDIGDKLKECNDTLSGIQLLGVSHVAVLPELILVGDQSSGKSSLMSALARLDLPTSSGICTRCPFHINMCSSKDSHWSCTVSLQQEYYYDPPANRAIKQTDITKRKQFPPWEPKPAVETIIFKTIYENDPTVIGEILRWAQIATLNPSQDPQQFVPGLGNYAKETPLEVAKQSTEARFSPNTVCLEMRGPGYPDLSFYDLPGLFQVAEDKGDDYLVDVVENLSRKYISHEGAIIMLALPMDLDLDNSKTLRVIRELNAESRTIGILTKADRPNFNIKDTVNYWLAVLGEKKQRVKQEGFYITSLPPDQPLENLEAWEESFFRSRKWPRDFNPYTARFGVDKLRCHVTKALGNAFACSLPDVKEKFKRRLEQIQDDLDKLPDLPENVEHEVRMSLQRFYASVRRVVDNQDFEQNFKELTEGFFEYLVQLKPECGMITERSKPILQVEEVIVVSDDSGNETVGSKRGPPKGSPLSQTPRKRRAGLFTTPVKVEGNPAEIAFQSPKTPTPLLPQNPHTAGSQVSSDKQREVKFSLVEIRNQIKLKTRGGFSDVVPIEVHETLCLKAVAQWEKPLGLYIDKATAMLMSSITKTFESSLKKFSKRLLYRESKELLMAFLKEEGTRQGERLVQLYRNETYKAVTINEGGLNYFQAKEKEMLLFARLKAAGVIEQERQFKRDEQMTREEKLEQSSLLDKYRAQFEEDDFKLEVDVAAKVGAYYMTAATRFVDSVSMDINSRLFRSFRDGALDCFLDEKLGLFPYPSYIRLMEEDAATAQRRQQLRNEREKLLIAMGRILDLERSLTGYRISSN
ncbi:P-loop containing nucleoside triphosphate hydrolase protein [Xylaria scruposa]|nr:P-loop containing nucleoside triphosphate hydrolase protein [Xylaria scruposa]